MKLDYSTQYNISTTNSTRTFMTTCSYNRFAGESAIDAGGVSREWYQLVSEALFAPALGLFRYAQTDNMTYTINPNTARHFNTYETAVKTFGSLEVAYRFAGWFLGKAVLVSATTCSRSLLFNFTFQVAKYLLVPLNAVYILTCYAHAL